MAPKKVALNCDLFPFLRGSLPWLEGSLHCATSHFPGTWHLKNAKKNLKPPAALWGITTLI